MTQNKSTTLYEKAKQIIPGGTQLLSKRPELFLPGKWPAYYSRCKGVEVWDLDDNKYIDMTISGVGACPLGYADPHVDAAVMGAVKRGNMCTLNVPEEVELAELLCALHPWAKFVRYARTGGEAMALAARIVRAYSRKNLILFCGYHGWHDWYLSANLKSESTLDNHLLPGLEPRGVPSVLKGTAVPFTYNDPEYFNWLFANNKENIAGVIMEVERNHPPRKDFLDTVRYATQKEKIPLVFDEITSGFRVNPGGIHMTYDIKPDVAVFAKAIGNGYPMAAVIGVPDVMEPIQCSFASSTYWTDRIGPTAALTTIKKFRDLKVHEHLVAIGTQVQEGWKSIAGRYGIKINVTGIPPLSHWELDIKNKTEALRFHTAFIDQMLDRHFLTSKSFYATYAHTPEIVERYLAAFELILPNLYIHLEQGTLKQFYPGPLMHTGFKRLT